MYLQHVDQIWHDHPALSVGALWAGDPVPDPAAAGVHTGTALTRLAEQAAAGRTEADLPEIQAWRRAFAGMGLKPTQYRCAAEALLRRLRKDGGLPAIHPVIDLCNAVSVAFAVPVAVLDLDRIDGHLEVRRATGDEKYETFAGDVEHPAPGEITFVDATGRAHARRWTNRQSGYSAVRADTRTVLVVVEALHPATDVARVLAAIGAALTGVRSSAVLTRTDPRFDIAV